MNRTSTTQQGLIKHDGLHSTTGAHSMLAHNSNKTVDRHVRHSIHPPLNHILLITHKFSSAIPFVAGWYRADLVCLIPLLCMNSLNSSAMD